MLNDKLSFLIKKPEKNVHSQLQKEKRKSLHRVSFFKENLEIICSELEKGQGFD